MALGREEAVISLTYDHAITISGISEELEPQSLKRSWWQEISPDVSGNTFESLTQIQAHKLLCTWCINICRAL